jgi:hypothetical protein
MGSKTYTNAELIEIGRKVVDSRNKQRGAAAERGKVKSALYKAYKEGKLGDFKV